jgi:hypothetical protein
VLVLLTHSLDDLRGTLFRNPMLPPGFIKSDSSAPVPPEAASGDEHVSRRAGRRRKLLKLVLELSLTPRNEHATQRVTDGLAALAQQDGQVRGGPAVHPEPQPESKPLQGTVKHLQRPTTEIPLMQERVWRDLDQVTNTKQTQLFGANASSGRQREIPDSDQQAGDLLDLCGILEIETAGTLLHSPGTTGRASRPPDRAGGRFAVMASSCLGWHGSSAKCSNSLELRITVDCVLVALERLPDAWVLVRARGRCAGREAELRREVELGNGQRG